MDEVTIFMPLRGEGPPAAAAEAKTYRPVQAAWLGGDIYRVLTPRPHNERWEYPSGSSVFAVKVHEGDSAIVIVAPVAASRGEPQAAAPPTQAARIPSPPPLRPRRLKLDGVGAARAALILLAAAVIALIGGGWLARAEWFVLHPADPIRASVVVGLLIVIHALWRVEDARGLRALVTPLAIMAAAFALSLVVGAWL